MNDNNANKIIDILWDIKAEFNPHSKTKHGTTSLASSIIKNQREIIDLLSEVLIELRNNKRN
jgi:hypothetical protein